MPLLKTPGFEGTSVKFSPFFDTRLAVSTGQNYAIIGNGRQYVLELTHHGISQVCFYDTNEILLDCAWCECNENLLVSASGNGSLKMWDTARPPAANPIASLEEHAHDACCVDWNPLRKDCFLSSAWDTTIKLWMIDRPASLRTFAEHMRCAYSVSWNPRHADVFASVSGDCTLRCWDVRDPTSVLVINGHDLEVLSCDWSKYDESLLVTGSVDSSLRVWDVRNHSIPVAVLHGHSQAVKRVKFSPHHENLIGSCSYDMTVCMWDFAAPENALLASYDQHTEFTTGFDMSMHEDNLLASVSYDDCVYVWPHGFDPRA
ncbi:hypothetical protein GOP47_0000155 [Adiantum capillus-veneris]|uniref:Peroxin-7 n=1 Tax=Adiantum capillus-veneris TaxID=13818 RepID=A0A9D4VCI4_ADICA|nr:hypothetical protein GOP47_0000155 [Adiantum capillus-veneris]